MKKSYILIILVGILLSACFKTEVVPPLMFDGEANMTIAEFQQLHELSATEPPTLIDTAVIISGIVTSTDKYGSCYKEIFLQDETGGISIRIANPSYYAKYSIGQRIFVKAKGLYLGNYISSGRNGFYQLGLYGNENGGMEYISASKENRHIFRSGIPETPLVPKIIRSSGDIVAGIGGDYHTLVKLVNCSFTEANGTVRYYEIPSNNSTTISRPIKFNTGTGTVEARISAFCTFAKDVLPTGTLNIEGLLTMFGTTPQLIIRSINDVEVPKVLESFDMYSDPFLHGWTNEQIAGEASWTYSPGTPGNVRIQAKETECRLVSPKLNFKGEKDVALAFKYRLLNGTSEYLQILYTIDGTNWNPLEFIPQTTGIPEVTLKLDENITSNPNLQIAFQYKTTITSPMWVIMNISFIANAY